MAKRSKEKPWWEKELKRKKIKLKGLVSEFGLPKPVLKEFVYAPWDELMKEEENGNTK